jgi:hypothetical protein
MSIATNHGCPILAEQGWESNEPTRARSKEQ